MPPGGRPRPAQESPAALSRVRTRRYSLSKGVVQRRIGAVRLGQGPPLTDWLVALSHESPFERPQARAARAGASPQLAAVPSLLSPLKDADRDVRLRAVTALGDLAGRVGGCSPRSGPPWGKQPFTTGTTASAPRRCRRCCEPARNQPRRSVHWSLGTPAARVARLRTRSGMGVTSLRGAATRPGSPRPGGAPPQAPRCRPRSSGTPAEGPRATPPG
jgi:hypothetical protein